MNARWALLGALCWVLAALACVAGLGDWTTVVWWRWLLVAVALVAAGLVCGRLP